MAEPRHLAVGLIAARLSAQLVPALAAWVQVIDAPEDAMLPPNVPGPGLRVCLAAVRPSRTGGLLPGGWRVSVASIYIEVRDVTTVGGARSAAETALREGVDLALTDWRPAPCCGPMGYDGGRRLGVAPGVAVQQDDYRVECVTE